MASRKKQRVNDEAVAKDGVNKDDSSDESNNDDDEEINGGDDMTGADKRSEAGQSASSDEDDDCSSDHEAPTLSLPLPGKTQTPTLSRSSAASVTSSTSFTRETRQRASVKQRATSPKRDHGASDVDAEDNVLAGPRRRSKKMVLIDKMKTLKKKFEEYHTPQQIWMKRARQRDHESLLAAVRKTQESFPVCWTMTVPPWQPR